MTVDSSSLAAKDTPFDERLVNTLNAGALCLMLSIGHRTSLFDTMAGAPPATSHEIAARAGLVERYVREWLGAMVVNRIVNYDPAAGTYWLPDEHARFLTRTGSGGNLAVYAQYLPLLGAAEDPLVACFREGGGVPYERFGRFHEIMAEDSGQTVLAALEEHILPLVPGLVARLEHGIRVLDVGCGRGRALIHLGKRFPRSTFVGYDLSTEAIATGRDEARQLGLKNVEFMVRDLSSFGEDAEPAAFDFVTSFDAIHDQPNPASLLRGIRRSLANDGIYLAQDIKASSHLEQNLDHPLAPFLYALSCMHCMTVSLAQGGAGLGAMWGRERALTMFREAGFGAVECHELSHDIQNDYFVCRP